MQSADLQPEAWARERADMLSTDDLHLASAVAWVHPRAHVSSRLMISAWLLAK